MASAKREQASHQSLSLEEQLEHKEELLSSVKQSINAANTLQVQLFPAASTRPLEMELQPLQVIVKEWS